MHETFLAEQIAAELIRVVTPHAPRRVTAVLLKVGAMRQAVDELLRFAMDVALQGTVAEGAVVTIETVPATGRCNACRRDFEIRDWAFFCPDCGGPLAHAQGGDDVLIESVTLETQEDPLTADR